MKKNKIFLVIYDNVKTLIGALLIAILIRSLLFQPFLHTFIFYGTNFTSWRQNICIKIYIWLQQAFFPFSPNISNDRFFSKQPERGDLVVFKTPADNRTDYIKRLIGLPDDTIQFINGDLTGATETYRAVEAKFPENLEAKEMLKRISYMRQEESYLGYLKTRQEMLEEIEREWGKAKGIRSPN